MPGRVLDPIIGSIIGRGRQSQAHAPPLALLVDDARGDGVGVMTTTRDSWDDKPHIWTTATTQRGGREGCGELIEREHGYG